MLTSTRHSHTHLVMYWQRLLGNLRQHDWLYDHLKASASLYAFKKCQKFPTQKWQGIRHEGNKWQKTAFTLAPTSHPSIFLHFFPLGTFNGIKLWVCKSDKNCLGLKHNTLTGLTRPFSPPPLLLRHGHLLLLFWNKLQWQAVDFLCQPLTCWMLAYWQTTNIISRNMKVFQKKFCLIVKLMHANH